MPNWLIALFLPIGAAVGWVGVNTLSSDEEQTDVQGIATISAEEQSLITARNVAESEATRIATSIARNVERVARVEAEKIAKGEALKIAEVHVAKRKAQLAAAEKAAAEQAALAKIAEEKMAAEKAEADKLAAEAAAAKEKSAMAAAAEKAGNAAQGLLGNVAEKASDATAAAGDAADKAGDLAKGLLDKVTDKASDAAAAAADVAEKAGEAVANAADAMGDKASEMKAGLVAAGAAAAAGAKAMVSGEEKAAEKPASNDVEASVRAEMTTEIQAAVDSEMLAKARERADEAETRLNALREAQEAEDKDTAELLAKLQAALADAENAREAAQKELATLKGREYQAPSSEEQAVAAAPAAEPAPQRAPAPEPAASEDDGKSFFMKALEVAGAEDATEGENTPTTIIVDGRQVVIEDSLAATSDPMSFGDPLDNFAEPPPRAAISDEERANGDSGKSFFMKALQAGGAETEGPAATTIVLDGEAVAVQDTSAASADPMVFEVEGAEASATASVAVGEYDADDAGFEVAEIDEAADDGRALVNNDVADNSAAMAEAKARAAELAKPFSVAGMSAGQQASMKSFKTLKQHRRPAWALAFSGDSQTLASGGSDRLVKTYSLRSRENGLTYKGLGGYASDVAYSPDGKKLAVAAGDGAVRVYSAASGKLLRKLNGSGEVSKIAYTPDSGYLAVGYDSGNINIFGADSGKLYRSLGKFDRAVGGLSVSADGKLVAANELDGDNVLVWNLKTGAQVASLAAKAGARTLQFKPKGSTLAVGLANGGVTLWNAESGKLAATLKGHDKAVDALAFSGNGKLLATGGPDQTVVLWDVAAEKKLKTLTGHGLEVFDIAFAKSGEYLAATGTGASVKVWSITK